MNNIVKNRSHGFTLIEVMIVLAIFSIIAGIVLQQGSSLSTTVELENASKNIDLKIRTAKARSIGALNDKNYGIHFESSKVVIFDGTGAYVDGAVGNEVFDLPGHVQINSIALNGGVTDIVFDRLTGNTASFGSIGLISTRDATKTKTIFINADGQNSFSSFNTSTGPAIANARHTHFDMGSNIGGPNNLVLKWYNYPSGTLKLPKTISMSGYFSGDRLNWEGTINESGINQKMTINSWLDADNHTVIDVIRHNTENDKLEIYFDAELIATYINDGTAITITPGSGVSLMEPQ